MLTQHSRTHLQILHPTNFIFLVYVSFVLFINIHSVSADIKIISQPQSGFCFEIHAGTEVLGSILEIKKFDNTIHSNLLFTQITKSEKTYLNILKSESDEHFVPLKSTYETYHQNKLISSISSTFENKNDKILISVKNLKSKKSILIEEPKGLVLAQQMPDLLFKKKSVTEISPKEKLVFQTFLESQGRPQQVTTELEGHSDHIVLLHQIEGQSFKTTHAENGSLISSHDLTKNIKLKPCSSSSVLSHLNSALSHNQFKSLFSSEDREKIKSCCQHF